MSSDSRASELKNDINSLKRKIEKFQTDTSGFETVFATLTDIVEEFQLEINELNAVHETHIKQNALLSQSLSRSMRRLKKMEDANDALSDQIRNIRAERDSMSKTNIRLRKRLRKINAREQKHVGAFPAYQCSEHANCITIFDSHVKI